MFKSQVYFSALILLLILSLFKYELHFDLLEKKSIHLRIAILSARENYHKRSTIRKSWMKSIEVWNKIFQQSNFPWKIDAKFILGTNSCNINPIERKSIYSCEEICPLSIESIAIGRSEYLFKHIKTIGKNFPFNGFSLQSYHSIVIKRVGIINSLNKLDNKLKILHAIDKKALLEIDLINFSEHRDSFYYQEIEFRLESNYPVLILIENVSLRNSHHLHLISQLNSSLCYIEILRVSYE
ncbi:Cell division control protein 2-like protein [Sarcoptes scabiei]|nr:Cell division control protein 2-like protein [Sarcoptes scabiei]